MMREHTFMSNPFASTRWTARAGARHRHWVETWIEEHPGEKVDISTRCRYGKVAIKSWYEHTPRIKAVGHVLNITSSLSASYILLTSIYLWIFGPPTTWALAEYYGIHTILYLALGAFVVKWKSIRPAFRFVAFWLGLVWVKHRLEDLGDWLCWTEIKGTDIPVLAVPFATVFTALAVFFWVINLPIAVMAAIALGVFFVMTIALHDPYSYTAPSSRGMNQSWSYTGTMPEAAYGGGQSSMVGESAKSDEPIQKVRHQIITVKRHLCPTTELEPINGDSHD